MFHLQERRRAAVGRGLWPCRATRWIPASAGMTVGTVRGGWRNAIQIPAFAGMTEGARGMIGVRGRGNVRNHGVYGASAGYADCS